MLPDPHHPLLFTPPPLLRRKLGVDPSLPSSLGQPPHRYGFQIFVLSLDSLDPTHPTTPTQKKTQNKPPPPPPTPPNNPPPPPTPTKLRYFPSSYYSHVLFICRDVPTPCPPPLTTLVPPYLAPCLLVKCLLVIRRLRFFYGLAASPVFSLEFFTKLYVEPLAFFPLFPKNSPLVWSFPFFFLFCFLFSLFLLHPRTLGGWTFFANSRRTSGDPGCLLVFQVDFFPLLDVSSLPPKTAHITPLFLSSSW